MALACALLATAQNSVTSSFTTLNIDNLRQKTIVETKDSVEYVEFSPEYKSSFGFTLGSFNSFSYKRFLMKNLALTVDLGFNIERTVGKINKFKVEDFYDSKRNYFESDELAENHLNIFKSYFWDIIRDYNYHELTTVDMLFWTFELAPNVVYQRDIKSLKYGMLAFYAGGGMNMGFADDFDCKQAHGKWGINADVGLEYIFYQKLLTLGIDLRPGYSVLFTKYMTTSIFDWKLAMTLRFVLNNRQ